MKLLSFLLLLSPALATAHDPSFVPHPNPLDGATQKYAERSRIMADLDGDGLEDMLLSGGAEEFGTMGGPWTVYLNRNGNYAAIGEIWAHPMAIAIEPDHNRIEAGAKSRKFARIWVYLKSSGSKGSLGYHRIDNESVDKIKAVEIYPGDGGTDLGRTIYKATFKKSPIPFKIQQSTTTADGKVTWVESKR